MAKREGRGQRGQDTRNANTKRKHKNSRSGFGFGFDCCSGQHRCPRSWELGAGSWSSAVAVVGGKRASRSLPANSYFIQLYQRTTHRRLGLPSPSSLSLFGHIPRKTRLTANELLQLSSCHFSSAFAVVVVVLPFFHYSGESEKNDENKVQVYRAEAANVVLVFSLSYSSLFYFHLNLHILLNGQRTGLV